jgi:hypothetical protein
MARQIPLRRRARWRHPLLRPGRAATNIDNVGDRGSPANVDLFIMRPIGLAMFAVSCGLYLPAAAMTAIARPSEMRVPYQILLEKPYRFVFVDPSGSH